MIGIPIRGYASFTWFFGGAKRREGFYNLSIPWKYMYMTQLGYPIDLAREALAEEFLKTDAKFLFFLDDDVVVPSNTLVKLHAYNVPIISCLYYRRHKPPPEPPATPAMWKMISENSFSIITKFPKGRLIEVDAVGLGACLIRRDVFERMLNDKPWFKFERKLSEDLYFCRKAKKHGFRILVDTSIVAYHIGEFKVVEEGKVTWID